MKSNLKAPQLLSIKMKRKFKLAIKVRIVDAFDMIQIFNLLTTAQNPYFQCNPPGPMNPFNIFLLPWKYFRNFFEKYIRMKCAFNGYLLSTKSSETIIFVSQPIFLLRNVQISNSENSAISSFKYI